MPTDKDKDIPAVETSAGGGQSLGYEQGDDEVLSLDTLNGSIETSDLENEEGESGADGEQEEEGTEGKEKPEGESEADEEETGAEEEEDAKEEPAVGKPEDLGEFKAEEAKKWEEAYTKDGQLNEQRLSDEFWANATKDSPGTLNEGTYAFLASKGISKEMAKTVEASLVQAAVKFRDDMFASVGGNEVVQTARDWAKEGKGYNEAQIAKFNKDVTSKDPTVVKDALDLLISRYKAANPEGKPKPKVKETGAATVKTKSKDAAAVIKPYKDQAEESAALRSIQKIKDNMSRQQAFDKHQKRVAAGMAPKE